jgi:hypothetical protein
LGRRGQCGAHVESKTWAPRGIGCWGEGEAGGEVTARGGVGGALAGHGAHRGNGDGASGVRCCWCVAARWGRGGWSAGWRTITGGWQKRESNDRRGKERETV